MNEQELIVIENQLTNGNKHSICNEMVYSLILALREERAKSADLQKEIDKITILRPIKNIQNNIKTIKKIEFNIKLILTYV